MELMDMSLDKFVERVYKLNKKIAEPILGKIAFSVNSFIEITLCGRGVHHSLRFQLLYLRIERELCQLC